jgi:UDP-glucose 4-epimerase
VERSGSRSRPGEIPTSAQRVDFRKGSLDDRFTIDEALLDVDVVYHLVSTTVPGTSNHNPVADIESNLIPTVKLLELMAARGVSRIVFISSGGTVYGPSEQHAIEEAHQLEPLCSYGIVKVAIEKYLLMHQRLHGLKPIILRLANAYGPRQWVGGGQGIIGTLLLAAKQRQPVQIWGDGGVVRDYVYVEDSA